MKHRNGLWLSDSLNARLERGLGLCDVSNGDVLTIDTSQPGGSGSVASQTKFKWATPASSPPAKYLNGSYLSGGWYVPGSPIAVSGGNLQYGTPTANILWAVPHVFSVAGTITDLAIYTSGNGGSSTKQYVAVYRSNASRTSPAARIFSGEGVATNFSSAKIEFNSLGLTVSADEMIWFSSVTNGPQALGLEPVNLYPVLGSNFDGTGTTNPLRNMRVGYRASFSYAQPPDPWTSTSYLLASDDSGAGAAVPLFKFTPS